MDFDKIAMTSLCSIEGEGAAGALGGGGGDPPAGDPPAGDLPAGDPPAGEPPADPEWLVQFSTEGGDADNPSPRDWVKSKGFKSLDDIATSLRSAEHSIRNGGKLTVPGDGAKPEEVEAFHKAIGRPEKAEDYAFDLPEGADIDEGLVGPLREAAFKAGVPKEGFKAIADEFVARQVDQVAAMRTAEDGDFGAWRAAQGDQADAKVADANRAMKALELGQEDVQAIQRGFFMQTGKPGSARVMDLLSKLGAGMAEDALIGGGAQKRFGVTGAEAQAEIDRLIVDQDFGAKLASRDPAAVQRWDRLNAAVAADRDAKARAAASG